MNALDRPDEPLNAFDGSVISLLQWTNLAAPSSADVNFAKQHDATMLRRLHQLVEQTEGLLRLDEHLRVDRCAVKAVSRQPILNLGSGVSIFGPFAGGALAVCPDHMSGFRRHSRTVQSLQQRCDRIATVTCSVFSLSRR